MKLITFYAITIYIPSISQKSYWQGHSTQVNNSHNSWTSKFQLFYKYKYHKIIKIFASILEIV